MSHGFLIFIETLWALLNSPIANAYAYSRLGTRDNIVGDIRKIPVPKKHAFDGVNRAAKAYLAAVSSDPSPAKLDALLLQVDAEVLKLYSLPLDLEQRVLGLFQRLETCRHPIFANSILADRA